MSIQPTTHCLTHGIIDAILKEEGGETNMLSQKTFFHTTGAIFSIVFLLQLLRLILGWTVVIAGWAVPVWFSFIALALAGYLAYNAFLFAQKAK